MKRSRTWGVLVVGMSLMAGLLVTGTAQANSPRVPKTDWPVCSPARVTYCVEAVTVTPLGGTPIALEGVASGQPLTVAAPASTLPTPADLVLVDGQRDPNQGTAPDPNLGVAIPPATDPAAAPEPLVEAVQSTVAFPNRWSSAEWAQKGLAAYGYDGLYVRVRTANEFVNHPMIDVLPAKVTAENRVFQANQKDNPTFATGLDPDLVISVKLRTGEIRAGVTLAVGLDVVVDYQIAGDNSTVTITGSPVVVPVVRSTRQCQGEDGKADANIRQFQAILFLQNDTNGFGVEGMTGDFYVGSNGVCSFSTPTWNPAERAMTFQVSAPHFAADGTTVNRGFYKAYIPVADAARLWGLTNPADAVTALTASITTEEGGSTAALFNISVVNGKIIIDASGFQYSAPKIKVALKKGYRPSRARLQTLTCVRAGAKDLRLTGLKLKCPTGYRARAARSTTRR